MHTIPSHTQPDVPPCSVWCAETLWCNSGECMFYSSVQIVIVAITLHGSSGIKRNITICTGHTHRL